MATGFSLHDRIAIFGNQPQAVQSILDYDFLCGKSQPQICCIINVHQESSIQSTFFFYGEVQIPIPSYRSLKEALEQQPITTLINFASARAAFKVTKEALESSSIDKIVVIAEGVPEREARYLRELALAKDKMVVGPATVGGIIAGVVKLGNAGGLTANVLANHLQHSGSVGIVSKSGGLLNELMTVVNRASNGVCEAIAIGGDRFPVTRLADQVRRFQENPAIKLIVMLGELGGEQEYEVAALLQEKKITKPLIAWISGTGSNHFAQPIQFGHAGAKASGERETAAAKLAALKDAGARTLSSYAELETIVRAEAATLGIPASIQSREVADFPQDFHHALKKKTIRYTPTMASSLNASVDGDHTYLGADLAQVSQDHTLGYVVGLLWFKKTFSPEITTFFELILKLTADHGAAVSAAHTTIVGARAGKDLVSSLAAGLLMIGPRFGGAVNEAAIALKQAVEQGTLPLDFVDTYNKQGKYIPGIGHRVKNKSNPDRRVELLKQQGLAIPNNVGKHLAYALELEALTTRKKDSLILNVDGAIAAILLDILTMEFTSEALDELLAAEALNAFFVLGRSIGLIGHFIDQKQLQQPLYRHPEWDILDIG